MFDHLGEDLQRYGSTARQQMRAMLLLPRVWALVAYRFARWVNTARLPGVIRKLLRIVVALVGVFVDVAASVELPPSAIIGPGLFIPHTGYIVLASDVRLGHHCTLTQGVTIGHGGGGNKSTFDSPIIGDRVYIGPGAAVIGPITIGDDALIGAGAVVIRSVPPRAVVVGNPARVISFKGSFDLISYPGMENDQGRVASLREAEAEQLSVIAEEVESGEWSKL